MEIVLFQIFIYDGFFFSEYPVKTAFFLTNVTFK